MKCVVACWARKKLFESLQMMGSSVFRVKGNGKIPAVTSVTDDVSDTGLIKTISFSNLDHFLEGHEVLGYGCAPATLEWALKKMTDSDGWHHEAKDNGNNDTDSRLKTFTLQQCVPSSSEISGQLTSSRQFSWDSDGSDTTNLIAFATPEFGSSEWTSQESVVESEQHDAQTNLLEFPSNVSEVSDGFRAENYLTPVKQKLCQVSEPKGESNIVLQESTACHQN